MGMRLNGSSVDYGEFTETHSRVSFISCTLNLSLSVSFLFLCDVSELDVHPFSLQPGRCIMTTCEFTNLRHSIDNDRTVNCSNQTRTQEGDLQAQILRIVISTYGSKTDRSPNRLPSWILQKVTRLQQSLSHASSNLLPFSPTSSSPMVRRAIMYKCE